MPFKSKAQRRKFAEMLVKGEISPETFEEWNRETGSADLPERVSRKTPRKSAAKKSGARKKSAPKKSARKKTTRKRAARRKSSP
jgi:topoisomerase IA-like protein